MNVVIIFDKTGVGGRSADLAAIRFPIVGGWGGRNADLAAATFRVPIWGGSVA